jgi:1-acyl-sn-glycerol-3-phosphate acyltransferase
MTPDEPPHQQASYDALLAEAARLYPGVRIGRPGRARTYWATIAALRAYRVKVAVDLDGAEHVAPGPAVFVANHTSTLDPVVVVMSTWWRVTAFTKVEWFEGPVSPFFRFMGQIPLRRGDDESTAWALAMAHEALAHGGRVGIYPEGTRGPDPGTLYRLHQRVLIPLLRADPDVPVHAITTTYDTSRWRTRARVRISERLPLDAATQSDDEMTAIIRDELLRIGGLRYVDTYAFLAKARRARELAAREKDEGAATEGEGRPAG